MCGIVGYIGKKEAVPVIIARLKALEYRGYDSAGLAIIDDGTLTVVKVNGYVENLQTGAYALGVLHAGDEATLYAARKSSSLVIGVGEGEYLLASDPAALVQTTHDIVYLKDGEVAEIRRDKLSINNLEHRRRPVEVEKLEWTLEQAQKGNFPHFMLKEIFEEPNVVQVALSGRLKAKERLVKLGGLESVRDRLSEMKRLILLACGTSYYAEDWWGNIYSRRSPVSPPRSILHLNFVIARNPLQMGLLPLPFHNRVKRPTPWKPLKKPRVKEGFPKVDYSSRAGGISPPDVMRHPPGPRPTKRFTGSFCHGRSNPASRFQP